jgi:hypothetical protein
MNLNRAVVCAGLLLAFGFRSHAIAEDISVASMPPSVVTTVPQAG